MQLRHRIQPVEKWIDEYQFTGRRKLSDEEREHLNARLGNSLDPINLVITASAATLGFILAIASTADQIDARLFGPFLALSIVFATIVPMQWKYQRRCYRDNVADLEFDEVEIYRTEVGADRDSVLVLLPRSGRMLSKNGNFSPVEIYLTVSEVALRYKPTQIPFPQQISLSTNHLSRVRNLTIEEKQELYDLLPKHHGWKWLMPLVLWAWTIIGFAFMMGHGISAFFLVRVVLLLVAALSLTIYVRIRVGKVAQVKADLQRGTVVCEEADCYRFEHLMKSDLLWTIDSRPASWRKRSLGSWICPTL